MTQQFSPYDVAFLQRMNRAFTEEVTKPDIDAFVNLSNERDYWITMYRTTISLLDQYDERRERAVVAEQRTHRRFVVAACAAAGFALLSVVLWVTR